MEGVDEEGHDVHRGKVKGKIPRCPVFEERSANEQGAYFVRLPAWNFIPL